jgi:hypothetical protein
MTSNYQDDGRGDASFLGEAGPPGCSAVDLFVVFGLPTTALRAKRENGGLGEDPPGNPMTHQQVLWTYRIFRYSTCLRNG